MTSPEKLPPALDAWLADHPDVTRGDLVTAWRLAEGADPLAHAPAPDAARIGQIRERLAAEAQAEAQAEARPALRRVPLPARRWPYVAVAATVALLLALGAGFWFRSSSLYYEAAPGQRLAVELQDGTVVELNSGSSLEAPRRFAGDARRVVLQGEAFFDVAEATAPFVIETHNAAVTVLGTSFNVRAWPGTETRVAVLTGTVAVEARAAVARTAEAAERRVVLEAGQAGHVADARATYLPLSTGVSATTAWREGGFFFDDEPYAAIFDEIERRFAVQIDAPEAIQSRRRTFIKQNAASAEDVLRDFCLSVGLRYRAIASGFEVYAE